MSALTYAELFVGLFAAFGAATLIMAAVSRTPRLLHDEIAQRIRQSVELIDGCKDTPGR